MNTKADWYRLLLIPLVLLLALLTLPYYETSLLSGIDPPLQWVFDHFYTSGFDNARELHFPHGPLAFFMYPLSNSLSIVVTVTLILKLFIAHLIFIIHPNKDWKEWVLSFVLLYVVFIVAQFNQLLIIGVLLAYQVHFRTNRWAYLFLGLFLTAFAIYIKSYVGIVTGVISTGYFIYQGVLGKSILKILIPGITLLLLYFLWWIFIYSSPQGFLDYFIGIIQLAGDNSSAASYYPWNNWWVLSLFLLLVVSIPLINKQTDNRMISLLILPMFFAGWKHGMAREDLSHYHGLISMLVIIMVVLIIGSKQKRMVNFIISAGCIALLQFNGKALDNYQKPSFQTASISRALQFWEMKPKDEINHHKISSESREIIGENTVDVYPWDYSIIAANGLNWQPRPVLHAYASYTRWLDGENDEHFNSNEAPEYIIWELNKITTDYNGGNMESIDNRYLLNNEPSTLLTLLKRYRGIRRDGNFLLLQKRNTKLRTRSKQTEEYEGKMDEWISLPSHGHSSLLRFQPKLKKSPLQELKSFFYKDEQYWILLKTSLGSVYKYRIVPKIAEAGLWINPLLIHHDAEDLIVTEVCIVSSGSSTVPDHYSYTWEEITFNEKDAIDQFFARKDHYSKTWPFYMYEQNYTDNDANWSTPNEITKSNREVVHEYSSTLSIKLDSVPFSEITVRASLDAWSAADPPEEVQLVLRIDGPGKTQSSAEHFKFQMLNSGQKNLVISSLKIDTLEEGSTLTAFVFNPKKLPLEIANFKVELLHP